MFKNHKRLQDVTNTREDNALYEETRVLKLHRINEEHTEYLLICFFWSWRGIQEENVIHQDLKPYCILTVSSSSSWTFLCTSEISINTTPEKKNETLLLLVIFIGVFIVLFPSRLENSSKLSSERYEFVLWTWTSLYTTPLWLYIFSCILLLCMISVISSSWGSISAAHKNKHYSKQAEVSCSIITHPAVIIASLTWQGQQRE